MTKKTVNFKKLFISVALIFVFSNSFAQWGIVTQKIEKKLICDVLSTSNPTEFVKGYNFFGPTISLNENIIHNGIELTDKKSPKTQTDTLQKIFSLKDAGAISRKTGLFYINIYTENVKSYSISIVDNSGHELKKVYALTSDKYQLPVENSLSDFQPVSANEAKNIQTSDNIRLAKLIITLTKRDVKQKVKFAIGECKFSEYSVKYVPARGYFFYELTGNDENRAKSFTVENIGNSYPILSFTMFRDLTSQEFNFLPKNKESDDKLKEQTLMLLRFIINKYPYYNERRISKDAVDHCLGSIISSKLDFGQKLVCIDSLVNTFSDGHFYLEKKQAATLSGPVFTKEIGDELLITGVLDEDLKKQLSLGARVTKINNVPIDKLIDSLMKFRHYGQLTDRRNQVVSRLLYKAASDSSVITITDQGNEKNVKYFYHKKINIPSNFKPVDQDFKVYNNNWAYYRLNSWNVGAWLTFYNHSDQLKKSKGVIFDLRGNSGGLEVEAYKIFSCFLEKPTTVSNSIYSFDDSRSVRASNIALPNSFLNLLHKSIIILVDNKTACASEIFINVMKNNCHAVIVGNERTSGSYASGEYFHLPYNIVFKTNVLNKFYPPGEENSIEFKGIEPDVYVPFYSYEDLYPYEDRVMQTALKIANADANTNQP